MITPEIKELRAYKYASEVINGEIVACELIKLACQRFLNDLERDDLEFRISIINKFTEFTKLLSLFEGSPEVIGMPMNEALSDWQWFFFTNILCFYRKDSGKRKYTKVLLNISRKNGKTQISALLSLWLLLLDQEGSPMVCLAANSREQSGEDFKFCSAFARQIDPKEKVIKQYTSELKTPFNNGRLAVFSSDSKNCDGYNPSSFLVDEMGGARDTSMVDVFRSGQAARRNPLGITISSAGFDLYGPFKKMCDTGEEILRGIKQDDSYFIMIYKYDEGDNWDDPANFKKVIPNFGISVQEDFVMEELQNAKNNSDLEVSVKTKTFNMWVSSSTTWISQEFIQKATRNISWDEFDENSFLFVGIDLAAVSDLTCLSFMFTKEDDDKLYFKNIYYLPEYTLRTSPNRELYKKWHREGLLKISSGNCTDYDYVLKDLLKHTEDRCLQKCCYDDWNATQFCISATEAGMPMYPVSQSITSLTKPTKTLERLMKLGKIVIDNNEITRWCFSNASIKSDYNENIKVIKGSKESKIDGVVSMIMAISGWLDFPTVNASCFAI